MGEPKAPRTAHTFKLPTGLLERLRAASKATGISMTRMVEDGARVRVSEVESMINAQQGGEAGGA